MKDCEVDDETARPDGPWNHGLTKLVAFPVLTDHDSDGEPTGMRMAWVCRSCLRNLFDDATLLSDDEASVFEIMER